MHIHIDKIFWKNIFRLLYQSFQSTIEKIIMSDSHTKLCSVYNYMQVMQLYIYNAHVLRRKQLYTRASTISFWDTKKFYTCTKIHELVLT